MRQRLSSLAGLILAGFFYSLALTGCLSPITLNRAVTAYKDFSWLERLAECLTSSRAAWEHQTSTAVERPHIVEQAPAYPMVGPVLDTRLVPYPHETAPPAQ